MTVRQVIIVWQLLEMILLLLLLQWGTPWHGVTLVCAVITVMLLMRLILIGVLAVAVQFYYGEAPITGFRRFARFWWQESVAFILLYGFWQMLPRACFPRSRQIGPQHVVFVHGFLCNDGFWFRLRRRCRAAGFSTSSVELPGAFASIDQFATLVEAEVARIQRLSPDSCVHLVAFSMGGLACRKARTRSARPVTLFTLHTPHQGTELARLSGLIGAQNGREMAPDSTWLAGLQMAEASTSEFLNSQVSLGFWSAHDTIVLPARRGLPPFRSVRQQYRGHLQAALDRRLHRHLIRLMHQCSDRPRHGH